MSVQQMHDLTTETGVTALMRSSRSKEEWNDNCDAVQRANAGYPDFWYSAVVSSGLSTEVSTSWGDATEAPSAKPDNGVVVTLTGAHVPRGLDGRGYTDTLPSPSHEQVEACKARADERRNRRNAKRLCYGARSRVGRTL